MNCFRRGTRIVAICRSIAAADGRSVLFSGHIDVAELRTPDAWTFSPFDAKVVHGRLYGLGSSDMKSSHAGFLLALESLRTAGVELAGDVIYESVIGEEMGEPGTQAWVSRGIRADFAPWSVSWCLRGAPWHTA